MSNVASGKQKENESAECIYDGLKHSCCMMGWKVCEDWGKVIIEYNVCIKGRQKGVDIANQKCVHTTVKNETNKTTCISALEWFQVLLKCSW